MKEQKSPRKLALEIGALDALRAHMSVAMMEHFSAESFHDLQCLIDIRTDTPAKMEFYQSPEGQALFGLTVNEYLLKAENAVHHFHPVEFLSEAEKAIIDAALGKHGTEKRLSGGSAHDLGEMHVAELLNAADIRQAFSEHTKPYLSAAGYSQFAPLPNPAKTIELTANAPIHGGMVAAAGKAAENTISAA